MVNERGEKNSKPNELLSFEQSRVRREMREEERDRRTPKCFAFSGICSIIVRTSGKVNTVEVHP